MGYMIWNILSAKNWKEVDIADNAFNGNDGQVFYTILKKGWGDHPHPCQLVWLVHKLVKPMDECTRICCTICVSE